MTSLRRSWLVQRLEKPRPSGILGKDNPFAFGGGLRNGGLSSDAMDLLRDIFTFDYMGAAEFEFGAVPQALSRMAQESGSLAATSFQIPLAKVKKGWSRASKTEPKPEGEATIYVLTPAAEVTEVERRIREWAAAGYGADLKEATLIDTTLLPSEDYHGRTVGWLELDNGFMFFTDREMWEQTCALFGVETAAEVTA